MTSVFNESTTFPFHEMQPNCYLIDMSLYDSPPTSYTVSTFLCMKSKVKQLQNPVVMLCIALRVIVEWK